MYVVAFNVLLLLLLLPATCVITFSVLLLLLLLPVTSVITFSVLLLLLLLPATCVVTFSYVYLYPIFCNSLQSFFTCPPKLEISRVQQPDKRLTLVIITFCIWIHSCLGHGDKFTFLRINLAVLYRREGISVY